MVDFLEIENLDDQVWSQKILSDIQFLCEISIVFGRDLSVIDIVQIEIKGKLDKVNSTRLVQSRQKEK